MSSLTQNNCYIKQCYRKSKAKGYCGSHYNTLVKPPHPLYGIWIDMRRRCNNLDNKAYPAYGGRGIKVCERWQKSFKNFLQDVGERPTAKHSLDRIDNNGDYEPGNIRWATMREQARNRRTSVIDQDSVDEARALYATGRFTQRAIALKYGVSFQHMNNIINYNRW